MNKLLPQAPGPIGVFDSGYGGLTILKSIRELLPQYDYVYLGDNARAPYGSRSFDIVYQFTRQAIMKLFEMGCQLVILGCNTASAKALRSIQQNDLPNIDPLRRVLGVIRPTAEVAGKLTETKHVGILATPGTIKSESYNMEINKLWPELSVTGVACPLWVPIVENNEAEGAGADYFVKKRINHILWLDPDIDTLILGCTHYPILMPKIEQYVPDGIQIVSQGEYVADSLKDYLSRHTDMDARCTKDGTVRYYTTENAEKFKEAARIFGAEDMNVEHIDLE
ncbi:glutamate racemase [Prevotella aurantiaca JCM 15754]|jgi:glutamate racemase|uniref:Glutamate racemase n=1 Tax=Prevotella aurantiaca TaxID=596085 RepID=A0A930HND6_9BACT|nr:glutamate racemase [Prevotella aurantiaca]MBF1385022.1 glutamate racemase [Prevotella aurantiaca]